MSRAFKSERSHALNADGERAAIERSAIERALAVTPYDIETESRWFPVACFGAVIVGAFGPIAFDVLKAWLA